MVTLILILSVTEKYCNSHTAKLPNVQTDTTLQHCLFKFYIRIIVLCERCEIAIKQVRNTKKKKIKKSVIKAKRKTIDLDGVPRENPFY